METGAVDAERRARRVLSQRNRSDQHQDGDPRSGEASSVDDQLIRLLIKDSDLGSAEEEDL